MRKQREKHVHMIPDGDWLNATMPPWPWPDVESVDALRKKLAELGIDAWTFKDSRIYRRHAAGPRPWLKDFDTQV